MDGSREPQNFLAPTETIYRYRLIEIAEWLEAGAPVRGKVVGFDMGTVMHEDICGTVCCIAGAAIQFFTPFRSLTAYSDDVLGTPYGKYGQRELGLTESQAQALFCPPGSYSKPNAYTPDWAARTIRHFLATGIVDWEATK
jgi:hypothetical protein